MGKVVIGGDPHRRSNIALVLDAQERVLTRQRFANDRDGYRELKRFRADLQGPDLGGRGRPRRRPRVAQRLAPRVSMC